MLIKKPYLTLLLCLVVGQAVAARMPMAAPLPPRKSANQGKILLLNGITSAGKTSIVKALQQKAWKQQQQLWLALGIDKMWGMMPRDYVLQNRLAEQGIKLHQEFNQEGQPIAWFTYGNIGKLVAMSFLQLVAHLARQGYNIILDEVLCDFDSLDPYLATFADLDVYMVAVHRDLAEAVEIELLRGDRPIGLARGQFARVHKVDGGVKYDLEVDTSKKSIFACTEEILALLKQSSPVYAFKQMLSRQQHKRINQHKILPKPLPVGQVVILHGGNSTGKTVIARALQHLTANVGNKEGKPFLHAGIDLLWQILPRDFFSVFEQETEYPGILRVCGNDSGGNFYCQVKYGKLAKAVSYAFIDGLKSFVLNGLSLVVDEVLYDQQTLTPHQAAFFAFNPLLVGVYCSYKDAQERELLRQDGQQGMVNGQFAKVHESIKKYDLIVNSSFQSPFDCASAILEKLEQQEKSSQANVLGSKAADVVNTANKGKSLEPQPAGKEKLGKLFAGWL